MTDKIIVSSAESIRKSLNFQFDISWQMLEYHLNNLGNEESLWRPATKGLHVVNESGTWHIIFWWSMVLDFSFGKGTLSRENIPWPGNMTATKERIIQLRDDWRSSLESLSDDDFVSCERTRWPFTDKPFYDLAGWLNLELMKNAAEIGYCRFLYATRKL